MQAHCSVLQASPVSPDDLETQPLPQPLGLPEPVAETTAEAQLVPFKFVEEKFGNEDVNRPLTPLKVPGDGRRRQAAKDALAA